MRLRCYHFLIGLISTLPFFINAPAQGSDSVGRQRPAVGSPVTASPSENASLKDLPSLYAGNIFASSLGHPPLNYDIMALQQQRYLTNYTNLEIYRNVLLQIAIDLMNADIDQYNTLNRAAADLQRQEDLMPKRQRVERHFHTVYVEDLLDDPQADKLARLILMTSYDARFLGDFVSLKVGDQTENYILLSFFDPTRIGDNDPKFYLARNIAKVEELVRLLVRNLPDEFYISGNLEQVSVDPFDLKIDLQRPESFLKEWEYRNSRDANPLPPFAATRQQYVNLNDDFIPATLKRRNHEIYSYPDNAIVLTEMIDSLGQNSERRIGAQMLWPMKKLDTLLGQEDDDFYLSDRDLNLNKADIPAEVLETISKFLNLESSSSSRMPYFARFKLVSISTVDKNYNKAFEIALQRLDLFNPKTGDVVASIQPEWFPYYLDTEPEPRASVPRPEELPAFSFWPSAEQARAGAAVAQVSSRLPAPEPAIVEPRPAAAPVPAPVPAAQVPSAIEGYFFIVDDRSHMKNILQLDGTYLCVPTGWQRIPALKGKGYALGFIEYDDLSDGIDGFTGSSCNALVIAEDQSVVVQELLKDYALLASSTARPEDGAVSRVAQEVEKICNDSAIQRNLYNCACVAKEYEANFAKGLIGQNDAASYVNSFLVDGKTECVNEEAILNESEILCYSLLGLNVADKDKYCECMGRKIVAAFKATPRFDTGFINRSRVGILTDEKEKNACM